MKMPDHITDGPAYPPEWDDEITADDRINAGQEAELHIGSADHWHDHALTRDEADQLARAMCEIESAINGNQIATTACLTALYRIRNIARHNEVESILDGD